VNIVAKERELDVAQLKDGLADGRVFSGRQAVDAGLIDEIGYFEDAVDTAKDLANIEEARLIKYVAPFSLRKLFELFGKSDTKAVKVQIGPDSFKLQSGRLYYAAEQFLP
jgi:protease-4